MVSANFFSRFLLLGIILVFSFSSVFASCTIRANIFDSVGHVQKGTGSIVCSGGSGAGTYSFVDTPYYFKVLGGESDDCSDACSKIIINSTMVDVKEYAILTYLSSDAYTGKTYNVVLSLFGRSFEGEIEDGANKSAEDEGYTSVSGFRGLAEDVRAASQDSSSLLWMVFPISIILTILILIILYNFRVEGFKKNEEHNSRVPTCATKDESRRKKKSVDSEMKIITKANNLLKKLDKK